MEKRRDMTGIIFIAILPTIALVLWLFSPGVSLDFKDKWDFFFFLGKAFGVVGMIMFAISMILSAKFKFLEEFFYGLNRVYIKHSQIGQIAFMLMLFHPILLLAEYTDLTFGGAVGFFSLGGSLAQSFGVVSLYLMIILIFLTLYMRPKYHIWKWTHKFMGLAFFFAGLHVFLIPSDTSVFLPLRIYVLLISGFAIYAFTYHTILGFITNKKYVYVVSDLKNFDNIVEVRLSPVGSKKMDFIPGQFAFISFRDKKIGTESHPFSMSSGLNDNTVSFTIKNLGDFTSNLSNLKIGTEVYLEGPFGKFSYNEAEFKKQIWIAGGIGITPFLSMAKSIPRDNGFSVDLYYCVRDEKEAVYLKELSSLENPSLNIIPFYSNTEGFINANVIDKKSNGIKDKSIFICSPVAMLETLKRQFRISGIPANLIHSEEFSL